MPQLTIERESWPASITLNIRSFLDAKEEAAVLDTTVRATDGSMLAWVGGRLVGVELDWTTSWATRVIEAYQWADVAAVVRAHRGALDEARSSVRQLAKQAHFLR